GDAAVKGAPVAVICPGTGLGVAGFIPTRPRPVVIASEGGHVTMAPADRRESALLEYLRGRFEHVSAERVLSGPGLENLYQAVAAVDGLTAPPRPAQEIVARALAGDSRVSVAALDCFCAMLGTMAGNLALTFGARGGIYIGGGVVPRFAEFLPASRFRERFESKGRFATYLERIPAFVIVHPDPAFLGLEALVEAG
ncbi:MAG: glucokinase, partial [Rhodospirillales bacterium]|nr:glucokinase [Rhodospirillales bacterium]